MIDKKQPTIIYIGGIEHNGSTLLGVILDQLSSITCVGELSFIPKVGWLAEQSAICSCGNQIEECEFWQRVRKTWEEKSGSDVETLNRLANRYDRNLSFPNIFFQQTRKSKKFGNYLHLLKLLLTSIASVSKNDVIVDTSKRVTRALALSMVKGIDLRVVHLLRDSRGVAYSCSKKGRNKSWWVSAFRWNMINYMFSILENNIGAGKVFRLNYEDLISEPEEKIKELGEFLGIDLSHLALQVSNGMDLSIGHLAVGNKFLRVSKEIKLQPNEAWREKMPLRLQKRVWFFTKVIMEKFGYEN